MKLFVEVWQQRGYQVNDEFFLHFDTLFEYGFLIQTGQDVADSLVNSSAEVSISAAALTDALRPYEIQFSMTKNGGDFLERYGGH